MTGEEYARRELDFFIRDEIDERGDLFIEPLSRWLKHLKEIQPQVYKEWQQSVCPWSEHHSMFAQVMLKVLSGEAEVLDLEEIREQYIKRGEPKQ